ncbi:ABC transporter ATP-binding protein [Paenibacillus lentus]|uniref:ABC transporter ATP-binding protein n=1 Tax=Paenibacillus lentus TaxID=1338368 RepID=A0A3S8RUJ8_9BACL|nr:ABC transporter ATP-binding protein [Paenibacillus lentus]AZK46661.1 ABC transporter ATP-binding protein [Paenibacillus lentus]
MQIQIDQVSKRYSKKSYGLHKVSFNIGPGLCGLIGRNGAGKTTLMRIIAGIMEATAGTVYFDGQTMKSAAMQRHLQKRIGYLPQDFGFYPRLTVKETMDYIAMLHGLSGKTKQTRIQDSLEKVHLDKQADKKVRELSGGMKRRLGIAQAIIHEPEILIVDEPTTGVDPEERISIRNLLTEYAGQRIVILSTHIIEDIAQSCQQVAVLDQGTLKYQGDIGSMIKAVSGMVWECTLPITEDYKSMLTEFTLVSNHYMGDSVRLRLLGEKAPKADSIQAAPTAEDAYIWMIGGLAP